MYTERDREFFGRFVKKRRVKGVLLDVDDCLLRTAEDIFDWGFESYLGGIMENAPKIDEKKLRAMWTKANNFKFKTVGVRIDGWGVAMGFLANQFPEVDGKLFFEKQYILYEQMYEQVPRVCDGALDVLDLFRGNKLKIVTVSHSDEKTGGYRLEKSGLRELVDATVWADPKKFFRKTRTNWQEGLNKVNLLPDQAMGAGDSKINDVGELYALGVACLAYISSPWGVLRDGGLPNEVPTLNNLGRWPIYLARTEERRLKKR